MSQASIQNGAPAESEKAGELREEMIWAQLKTVRDPEIPVNIVDLGLIYGLSIEPAENGKRIELRMTLTAPGCSMSDVIKREIEYKLARLAGSARGACGDRLRSALVARQNVRCRQAGHGPRHGFRCAARREICLQNSALSLTNARQPATPHHFHCTASPAA